MDYYIYVIAIIGSAFAGAVNTLAGNGSAITLTILTELIGLTPNMANGTNRIGVVAQSMASTFAFYRNGRVDLSRSWVFVLFTAIGAIAGIIVATQVSNEQFKQVFRYLMILMLFVVLVNPKRWLIETDLTRKIPLLISVPLFLALGFYGGFIQMGMGIFFLAIMVLFARFSLIDSNVVKSLVVALYTIFAVVVFHWSGMINWKIGLLMAVGQTAGGYATAVYASKYKGANLWAHRLLVVVVVIAILKLFNVF